MSRRVADLLVETLQASGVKTCYGIVGDTMNRIAHAIDRSQIDWVHVRHEEAGAFAAAAEASLTGRLTACAGTCGPGSLHFINGLYEANRNRAPVILIATQIVRQDLGFESIQEIDFDDVFKGCSVYCEMILTPEQARRKTVAACQAALTKRGVAVLVVPADVANAAAHDEPPYTVHTRRPLIRPSEADLDAIAAILNKSDAITIYAGAGCAGAHDEVVAAAARLKAPMAHTSRGKDFVEYDNPYNVGMTGIIGGSAGYHAILDCDVLLPRLQQHDDGAFLAVHRARFEKDTATARAEAVSGPDAAISGTYLTQIINQHAAEDALFAADDGTASVWMLRHIDTNGKRRTFASLLHGTMAGGMPSALGLQKCQPGRQVICLAGDGGFAMLLGDLLTTVQEDLPIKIVIYDNGKLGFVDIEQKAAGLVPLYTDLKNPDFGEVARAVGLWGHCVEKAGELHDSVQTWLAQPGPALLHVKVKPMQLVMPPSPFVSPEAVVGKAAYSARAMQQGEGQDVWEMVVENIP